MTKPKRENKEIKVTPCCKTKLWHFVHRVELPSDAVIRCELCGQEMDVEVLETIIRSTNPVTYFCDRCGVSDEMLSKQKGL